MSSLENGLRILALLSEERLLLRVTDVARDLSIPKASVSRLLKILAEAHYIERDAQTGGYTVGQRPLGMAQLYLSRHSVLDLVDHAVKELVDTFGFTGHAGIVSGAERVLLIARQGWYPLQHTAKMAERVFAFDSIIGQAILARDGDETVLETLGISAPGATVRGFDKEAVITALEAIRRDRIACANSLITPGISSIGSAVGEPPHGEIIGFCLSFPSHAADKKLRNQITEAVLGKAHTIGRKLGDPFWLDALVPG